MLTAIRARLRHAAGEDGLTLMELVVGMALACVVGALMVQWFVGASDTTAAASDSSLATASARGALQSWAADLQLAGSPTNPGSGTDRIASLSRTSIDFHAHLDNAACSSNTTCGSLSTTEIVLSLVDGNLLEQVGDGASNVVVPGNDVTAGNCLFTAYAGSTELGCDGLSPTDLDGVTSISLAFTVSPHGLHPRSFATSATFTTYGGGG